MRAALALSMSTEGVVLYSASGGGWTRLGRANFAERNLATQMSALRRVAAAYSSDPDLPTLLVVPAELVLWRSFAAAPAGSDPVSVNVWLAAQMAGQTPYDPADLRIDWRRDGTGVQVAVIAKETMREAEEFAAGHGFSPCGVAAVPPGAGFPDTAHFGLTGVAAAPDGRPGLSAPDDAAAMRPPRPEDISGAAAPQAREAEPRPSGQTDRPAKAARPATMSGWRLALPGSDSRVPLFVWLSAALIAALALAALLMPDRAAINSAVGQFFGSPAAWQTATGDAEIPLQDGTEDGGTDQAASVDPEWVEEDPGDPATAVRDMAIAAPAAAAIRQPVPVLDLAPAIPDESVQPALDIVRPVDALALADAEIARPAARPAAPTLPARQAVRVPADARGAVPPAVAPVRTADTDAGRTAQALPAPGNHPELPSAFPEVTRLASAEDLSNRVHPLPRPGGLKKNYEQVVYGGLTRDEFERMRPIRRNAAHAAEFQARFAQPEPKVEIATATTIRPTVRPVGLARKSSVSAARTAQQAATAASTAALMAKPPTPVIAIAAPAVPPVPPKQEQVRKQEQIRKQEEIRRQEETRKQPRTAKERSDPALDDNEPDIIPSLAPDSRPVNAPVNVAARATEKNELDLSEINLLGTFGRPGAMRAMVRTSNGRISTVQTGDRLDGGQVIAISQNELRYLRRGRNIRLTMPDG